jgi:hypothetical protein
MADPIKRLNYFNGQFLRAPDFTEEQTYHLEMRRRHNQKLHTWGIADGLELKYIIGSSQIQIAEGMAIDSEGREIVLVEKANRDLSGFANKTVYVTIVYGDELVDKTNETGVEGFTRLKEIPTINVSENPPSAAQLSLQLILGRVTVNSEGKITATDEGEGVNRRRAAGVVAGDLEARSLTLTDTNVDPSQWSQMRLGAAGRADLQSNLRVTGNLEVIEGVIQGELANGSVSTNELANGAVTVDKLADNSVNAAKIIDGSVGTNELANGAVTVDKLADNSVNAAKIIDGSIGTNELANGAVTVDKLADNSVNAAKIIDGSVGTNELANGAVTVEKLADNSVNAAKIIDSSVGTAELANGAVTVDKLADNSVNAAKIIDSSVGTNELANGAVTVDKLADNSVNAAKIIDGSVGTNELANTAVTLDKLADNSVNAAKIIDGSVGTNELANGAVNAYKLSPLQVQGEGFQRCLYTNSSASSNDLSIAPRAYGIQNSANASTAAVGTTSNFSYAQSVGISNNANASTTASEYSNVFSYGISSSANASSTASGSQIDNNYYNTYTQSYGVSASANASTTGKLSYAQSFGVQGNASANSKLSNAISYGVLGSASATSTEQYAISYGVYGSAYASQEKAQTYGVYSFGNAGQSYSNSPVYGVYAQGYFYRSTPTQIQSPIYGVYARSDVYNATQVNSSIYGVSGEVSVTATEIKYPVYGVYGSAYASQANSRAYGVYAAAGNGVPLYVAGKAIITGGVSSGHITDRFINRSGQRLRTGDVVKLKGTPIARFQGENNNVPIPEVTLADQENDNKVIGIVDSEAIPGPEVPDTRIGADDPTFIEDGGDLYVVILGAYAHCKVDATEAPIEVGDLLTSSNNPGHAKKATDPKLGSIIGKALEPLEQGTGYIAVFVNIQ